MSFMDEIELLNKTKSCCRRYVDEFSESEEYFRRGYLQGFFSGRNSDVSFENVREWANNHDELDCPPGTPMGDYDFEQRKERESQYDQN